MVELAEELDAPSATSLAALSCAIGFAPDARAACFVDVPPMKQASSDTNRILGLFRELRMSQELIDDWQHSTMTLYMN
ncbi:MAG TPA: hypothetical protein HPP83_09070 [Candidatus Hydrogenedentes bacterium]|nr:hypothetical protein [Candidatus Hydrogenedentota bacterium]